MSSVKTEDIAIEQSFFGELWGFRKKYYNADDSEEYWGSLINAAEGISKKYGNNYLDQMLLVCIDDIEDRFKQATGSPYRNPDMLTTLYERLKKGRNKC